MFLPSLSYPSLNYTLFLPCDLQSQESYKNVHPNRDMMQCPKTLNIIKVTLQQGNQNRNDKYQASQ